MKTNNYFWIIGLFIFAFTLDSCQPEPEPGGTAVQNVSGEWWVKYYLSDGAGGLEEIAGYSKVITFNTASNTPDSLWVSDLEHFWDFQVKAPFNKTNMTFSGIQMPNLKYESGVTISGGKVLLGQGKSVSGVKTDSIYFLVSFSDDQDADKNPAPYGNEYIVGGHRRTGFLEDELE